MNADVAVAHVALKLLLGNESRDGVDDYDVYRAGTDERLANLKRLVAAVRLGDEKLVDVDAEVLRVNGVERVLCVDERRLAALLLNFRYRVESYRRFTGGFRSEYLDDPSLRKTADAERQIEAERAGRNCAYVHACALAELDDRAFAVASFELGDRGLKSLLLRRLVLLRHYFVDFLFSCCHR